MGNHSIFKQETCRILFHLEWSTSIFLVWNWVTPIGQDLHYPNDEHLRWGVSAEPHVNENEREKLINMPDPCNEILDGLGQYQNRKYRHNWMKCSVDMRILVLNMFNVCTDKPFKQNCLAESWKYYQMLGLDARTSLYFFIRTKR